MHGNNTGSCIAVPYRIVAVTSPPVNGFGFFAPTHIIKPASSSGFFLPFCFSSSSILPSPFFFPSSFLPLHSSNGRSWKLLLSFLECTKSASTTLRSYIVTMISPRLARTTAALAPRSQLVSILLADPGEFVPTDVLKCCSTVPSGSWSGHRLRPSGQEGRDDELRKGEQLILSAVFLVGGI